MAQRIKLSIRLPEELNKKVEEACEKEYLSKNQLIILACKEFIEKQGSKKWTKKN